MDVVGTTTYFCNDAYLEIVDLANTSSPNELGNAIVPSLIQDITVNCNYVYVADGWCGLPVINISDPQRPYEIGFLKNAEGYASSVVVS